MLRNRKYKRYTRRLETEFRLGERVLRGISSNISERGLFIRTSTPLTIGSHIDATIFLHDGRPARISGIVRRAVKTNFAMIKNGMGIELTAYDDNYLGVLRELDGGAPPEDAEERGTLIREDVSGAPVAESPQQGPEFLFVICAQCGANNKVRAAMLEIKTPKCGKCKAPLPIQ